MTNKAKNYVNLLIIYLAFTTLIVQYLLIYPDINIYKVTGLLLIIFSLTFFTIARVQLGSSFQVSATAIKLVTEGIYKKIRHPIYFFGLLFLLGVIIFLQNFYLLILWIAIIFMQLIRIKKEEKVLEEKFGEQYQNYKKNTWF